MKLATFAAVLVALALPSMASAVTMGDMPSGASWNGVTWTFPGQRLANNYELNQDLAFSDKFWGKRGLQPCRNRTVWRANTLGLGVLGRSRLRSCEMWINKWVLWDARDPDIRYGLSNQVDMCTDVLHEVGHLSGLGHSKSGIMRYDGGDVNAIDVRIRHGDVYLGAEGPCGYEVARRYHSELRRAHRARMSLHTRSKYRAMV